MAVFVDGQFWCYNGMSTHTRKKAMSVDPFESPQHDASKPRQKLLLLEIGWGSACVVALGIFVASIAALFLLESRRYLPEWVSNATWDQLYQLAVLSSNLSGFAAIGAAGAWLKARYLPTAQTPKP